MIQSLVDKSFVHRNYAATEYSLRDEVLRNLFFLKSPTICHGQKFSRKVDKKFRNLSYLWTAKWDDNNLFYFLTSCMNWKNRGTHLDDNATLAIVVCILAFLAVKSCYISLPFFLFKNAFSPLPHQHHPPPPSILQLVLSSWILAKNFLLLTK